MNVCELRLYNSMGVIMDRVSFMSSPFASPLGLKIPRPTKRQLEIGVNLFRDGSDIAESKYNNAQISLQPTMIFGNCSADEGAAAIEGMRKRLNRILEESRLYVLRRTYNYVRFAEDTKGFVLESEIMDGNFEIEDDWSWSPNSQGVVATATLTLSRRPFRLNPKTETVMNYVNNPSFELCDNTGCYLGWTFSGGSPNITIEKPYDSIDGDKSLKITEVGGVSSGGHSISQNITKKIFGGGSGEWTVDGVTESSVSVMGSIMYLEAWIAVTGDPTKARWDLWIDGISIGQKVSWTPGEVPSYKDHRWYANRQEKHPEDSSIPNEYSGKKHFIRKGIFVLLNSLINSGYTKVGLAHANLGGSPIAADTSAYIDRIYLTRAINFLGIAKCTTIYWRLVQAAGSAAALNVYPTPVSVIVDPGTRPHDIEFMPKAWGSASQINTVYDHGSGLSSYIDLDSIPGDAPANVEVEVKQMIDGSDQTNTVTDVIAAMAARHSQYFIREGLVLPNNNLASLPLNTTDLIATSASSKTVSSSTYSFTTAESFYIDTGSGRTKKAGNYHVIVRLANNTDYTLLRARYAVQIGFSDQHLYGPEVLLPITPNSLLNYVVVDLGVINISDLQDNSITRIFVQYRAISGSQIVSTDSIILLPSDEWFASGANGVAGRKAYRIGSINGRDNMPLNTLSYGGTFQGPPTYISSHSPYLVPGRLNRIYFSFNHLVSTYFRSAKKQTAEYWLTGIKLYYTVVKYQERYL